VPNEVTYVAEGLDCSVEALTVRHVAATQIQAVEAGVCHMPGVVEEAQGGSGGGGHDEVVGRVCRMGAAVAEFVDKEQKPCSGCRAASRREKAAILGMVVVRIADDILGVVAQVHMRMP